MGALSTGMTGLDRRTLLGGLASAGVLAACSRAPGLMKGESGVIARVSDGDLLALDTGLRVRLAEIEAPSPYGEGAPYGEEARALLEREAIGRIAQLYYGGLSRDRYERALAHVFAQTEAGRPVWLNGLMVGEGAARVRTYPDNAAKVRDLYALERQARATGVGLWALDDYRIRRPGDWPTPAEPRSFMLVEAPLLGVDPPERYGAVRLASDGVRLVTPQVMAPLEGGLDLTPGRIVRIRGRSRIHDDASVTIDFSHWAQMEMVEI